LAQKAPQCTREGRRRAAADALFVDGPGARQLGRPKIAIRFTLYAISIPAMKLFLASTLLAATFALGANSAVAPSLADIPLKDIDGQPTSLKPYAGKVLLIVNVASKCGNTPQYAGLESLYEKYKDQGLVVLGFPCNDFGSQEPGSDADVKEFCTSTYHVTFPMFDKLHVKGPEQHPLYTALTGQAGAFPGDVKWNFGKFLVGRNGQPLQRFEPGTKPEDARFVAAVEQALAAK
jgi:glutathione peroxidase